MIRSTFWSLARLGKGRSCYWTAYWTGSPLDDASREPDAKGKAKSVELAEQAAREAIRASQADWRFQVIRTLDRFAEAQAIIDGLCVFAPPPPKPKQQAPRTFNPNYWRIRELEIEAEIRASRAKADEAFRRALENWARPAPTCFATLGVTNGATVDDIKRAFRRKALDVHPDRGGTHEQFCQLNEAYQEAIKIAETGFQTIRVPL